MHVGVQMENAAEVVAMLRSDDRDVSGAATTALQRLHHTVQAQMLGAVAAMLADRNRRVRACAVRTLGVLRPSARDAAQHAEHVFATLRDADAVVRLEALWALRGVPTETREQRAADAVSLLQDADWRVRRAAVQELADLKLSVRASAGKSTTGGDTKENRRTDHWEF